MRAVEELLVVPSVLAAAEPSAGAEVWFSCALLPFAADEACRYGLSAR
jgi:hypothetical protein